MINLSIVLTLLSIIFGVFIVLRTYTSIRICALCAATVFTWLALLVHWYLGGDVNTHIIAILMGGSIVGALYALEEKFNSSYSLFKFPLFITLITFAFWLTSGNTEDTFLIPLIIILWTLFFLLFLFRGKKKVRALASHVIKCCRDW
ncbi:MAG: hypothetical protein WDZ70_01020 [Candidatus Paceibacterota bacterium]